ncbi:hypothetical protein GOP47_0009455 [Adiantum capillus-veneris]|uniref:Uncharacterized protein n=1 Tax=Adiantum capillus-veneris TaxID=13818 RepID=A0A9D4UWM8_ADICA|nr:hypothetical protein GOP47_0009455 [Adiantum capillus-veneris]
MFGAAAIIGRYQGTRDQILKGSIVPTYGHEGVGLRASASSCGKALGCRQSGSRPVGTLGRLERRHAEGGRGQYQRRQD